MLGAKYEQMRRLIEVNFLVKFRILGGHFDTIFGIHIVYIYDIEDKAGSDDDKICKTTCLKWFTP